MAAWTISDWKVAPRAYAVPLAAQNQLDCWRCCPLGATLAPAATAALRERRRCNEFQQGGEDSRRVGCNGRPPAHSSGESRRSGGSRGGGAIVAGVSAVMSAAATALVGLAASVVPQSRQGQQADRARNDCFANRSLLDELMEGRRARQLSPLDRVDDAGGDFDLDARL